MSDGRPRALLVERAGPPTSALIAFLRQRGLAVRWAGDGEAAWRVLESSRPDGLIAPLRAPGIDGLALLRRARVLHPTVCAVLLAPGGRRAVEALRAGAYDVLPRPLDRERLLHVLRRGLAHQRLAARVAALERGWPQPPAGELLTGRSRALARVMEQVRHLASTQAAVLIEGEAGAGKGRVARAIHEMSPRYQAPFGTLDCGSLDAGMTERALFGVEGSVGDSRPGLLEQTAGGTVFLEEVGEASPGVQVRLLRLLQDRAFERVGGRGPVAADVRLITASSADLAARAREGHFREDLLQRLGMVRVAVPPLRERREDIPLLVERFLGELSRQRRRRVPGVTRGVMERLERHMWPGNVRELRDTIEAMVISAPGGRPLDLADLPAPLRASPGEDERLEIAVGMTVEEAERLLITATLEHAGHDKPRAAAMLGIGLRTLYRKIQRYGIRQASNPGRGGGR